MVEILYRWTCVTTSCLSESHFYERSSAHDDPLAEYYSEGLVILGDCIIDLWYPTRELIWREL